VSHFSSSIMRAASSAMYRSYGWMSLGLMITASISYILADSYYIRYILFGSSLVPILIFLAQFAIIIMMSGFSYKLSYQTMLMAFLGYSVLTGITMSAIFIVFDLYSIVRVFFIASGMFLLMAGYGASTKHDLSAYGTFGISALFGVILLSFVNVFIRSASFDYMLSFIAVIAISALIAFDMQRLKAQLSEMAYDYQQQRKLSIYGALTMYINFIALFVRLLHILGRRRD
jgi:uncharacterized protein